MCTYTVIAYDVERELHYLDKNQHITIPFANIICCWGGGATETTSLSTEDKADIFALRFISKSKAIAKSVKQSLKRNSSFQSFGLPLTEVLERLEKRQLISSVNGDNDQNGRMTKRYKVSYDNAKSDHKEFLQKYLYIFPGETFKKDDSIVH